MKYRIVQRKDLYYNKIMGRYEARDSWDVEERFLFFFWTVKKGFWDKEMAESYHKSITELHEN
jgi:hypothetical protein